MAKKQPSSGISLKLQQVMDKLLDDVLTMDTMPVEERVKILDRAIKLEELKKLGADNAAFGSGFNDE